MGAAMGSSGAACADRGVGAGPTGEQDLQLTQYLVGGQAGAGGLGSSAAWRPQDALGVGEEEASRLLLVELIAYV